MPAEIKPAKSPAPPQSRACGRGNKLPTPEKSRRPVSEITPVILISAGAVNKRNRSQHDHRIIADYAKQMVPVGRKTSATTAIKRRMSVTGSASFAEGHLPGNGRPTPSPKSASTALWHAVDLLEEPGDAAPIAGQSPSRSDEYRETENRRMLRRRPAIAENRRRPACAT